MSLIRCAACLKSRAVCLRLRRSNYASFLWWPLVKDSALYFSSNHCFEGKRQKEFGLVILGASCTPQVFHFEPCLPRHRSYTSWWIIILMSNHFLLSINRCRMLILRCSSKKRVQEIISDNRYN
ncbi:hypothetical protein KP509_16G058400 [Ceratopteris richardii]|uniref:Uncharacterized protein n=1 Tax=Ceratopteris richardii TaxID=49495 RepID=A0A8T2T3N2_CERRI|nr:hypothetical protein KP509_16G058400 [Ceratopteris richardii]